MRCYSEHSSVCESDTNHVRWHHVAVFTKAWGYGDEYPLSDDDGPIPSDIICDEVRGPIEDLLDEEIGVVSYLIAEMTEVLP